MAVVAKFKSRKSVYTYLCCRILIPTRKRKIYNCKRYFFNLFLDTMIFGDCAKCLREQKLRKPALKSDIKNIFCLGFECLNIFFLDRFVLLVQNYVSQMICWVFNFFFDSSEISYWFRFFSIRL